MDGVENVFEKLAVDASTDGLDGLIRVDGQSDSIHRSDVSQAESE
jgi:hypothetical protein